VTNDQARQRYLSAARAKRARNRTLNLGPLPVALINRTLGRQLRPGPVVFRAAEQDHAHERHGADYLRCLPFVGLAIASPTFIGQSPRHPEGFELVKVTSDGLHVLVALAVVADGSGAYPVQSLYPISKSTAMRRLRKSHLFHVSK
jgi:hypothetical protein